VSLPQAVLTIGAIAVAVLVVPAIAFASRKRKRPPPVLLLIVSLTSLLVAALAGCTDPDFRHGMGAHASRASAPTAPTIEVDNPFWCPRRAGP
jgi:MFS superfamily sulfate permease-like transporter